MVMISVDVANATPRTTKPGEPITVILTAATPRVEKATRSALSNGRAEIVPAEGLVAKRAAFTRRQVDCGLPLRRLIKRISRSPGRPRLRL